MKKDEEGRDPGTSLDKTPVTAGGPAVSRSAPGTAAIADLPLSELSGMIRSGKITARELVQLYLQRIEQYDGKSGLNSYITVAEENALKEAEQLDALAKQGRVKGLLHGLPIAVKDNLDTKGIRTTGGSGILSAWLPPADSTVVERLRNAGAIILGKTNMHELAFGITTNNPHYGPARNPYDRTRIPGGSSGGSGTATAAALCAGAIGTDTGGSVRIPSALCGVVGLKPTIGRVGRGGMMHLSFTRDVIGPITRSVADAAMLLQAMTGHDTRDPGSSAEHVPDYSLGLGRSIKGKQFGVPRKYFFDVIHPDTEAVMEGAIRAIQKLGGTVKEVEIKNMDIATGTGFNIVLAEAVYHVEEYLKAFDPEATIDKYLSQFGPDVQAALGSQKGAPGSAPVPGYTYIKSVREERQKMIAGFEEAMSGLDALLLPTTPLPAAPIGEDVETELNGQMVNTFLTFIRNCDPVSVVGYPAITVPAGYSNRGLPIGLQIVMHPRGEAELLNIAYAFEKATHVRVAPGL
jgi:Asp-tRNA(Asn)/Glu-tRNA(Gln) amidotransferase A subunit family amidase